MSCWLEGRNRSHALWSSPLFNLRSLSSISPSLIPLAGRRVMTDFFPSPMMNTLDALVAKRCPYESLMWAMSKLLGCFSTCWRIPTLPMLLPPMIKTWAPFSYLMRLSTSPVSRFNYNLKGIFNINIFKRGEKRKQNLLWLNRASWYLGVDIWWFFRHEWQCMESCSFPWPFS